MSIIERPAARGHRRVRALGLLRGGVPPRPRGPSGGGRHARAAADAMGARALGRRARPPEDQVGHARVREDGRAPALSLVRQRRRGPRRVARRAARALRRHRLCRRRRVRPSAGRPGRRPAGSRPGDPLRRLVQRPPRPSRSRLRPLGRARRGHRQRQRRRGRRADAVALARRAAHHRHRRSRPRRHAREPRSAASRCSAGAAPCRPPSRRPSSASSASWSARTSWSTPPISPWTITAWRRSRTRRHPRRSATSPCCRASPPAPATRSRPRTIALRFLRSPVEIVGDGRVEGVVVAVNELVLREDGTLAARPTGEPRRCRRASCSARSATADDPSPDCRSTTLAA